MREILFKAKCKNWKELPNEQWWVEGYYAELGIGENKKYYIIQNGALPQLFKNQDQNMYFIDVEVEPSTLCRHTGLTDKNGKKIWENDIVSIYDCRPGLVVKFKDFSWQCRNENFGKYYLHRLENNSLKYEVIGNVFDNPELLEQEESAE